MIYSSNSFSDVRILELPIIKRLLCKFTLNENVTFQSLMHQKKLWLKEETDGLEAYPLHLKANYQWQNLGETGSRRNEKTD